MIEALREVEDPELGMDIVELGLMYDVEVDGPRVKVLHSLTSMGCPAGPMIQEGIHDAAAAVPGVEDVEVELTWDPPWTPDRMSDDASSSSASASRPLRGDFAARPARVRTWRSRPGRRSRWRAPCEPRARQSTNLER